MPSPIIPWICPNCFTHRPQKMGQPPKYPPPCPKCGSNLKRIRMFSVFHQAPKNPKAPQSPRIPKGLLLNLLPAQPSINTEEFDFKPFNPKAVIIPKEYLFLQSYLCGEVTIIEAMDQAGYENLHEKTKYLTAKRIIEKYESQAEDHRNIARALGAGEVFIIQGLMDLAKKSKSDMVKRAALADLAKILGLTKEQLEGAGGVTIIFEGADTPGTTASLPGAPPLPPSQGEVKVIPSTKPMMITK